MIGGLELLIGLPLLGAILVAVVGRDDRLAAWLGVAVGSVTLGLSAWAWVEGHHASGFRLQSDETWIDAIDVHWRLGVDSLSAPLVVVTALLSWCCLVALVRRAPDCGPRRHLVALVLLIEAGSLGTFLSLDLIVFFVFFELVLIPMWFVIADWGDADDPVGRRAAATRFLVVTVTGSALMLVAFLLLHHATGTFDIPTLLTVRGQIPHSTQLAVAVLLMLGFGAKVPMWPLHFWLPDAHSKAPTVGSVLLAGVLLKLGTYGLLRFWRSDAFPHGAVQVSPYLGALGVVGILYGALACLAQRDLKRLIAYSSIGHMGFVLLAISTLTRQGQLAANFVNVAHALITGLLFFIVGAVKDRVHSAEFATVGRGLFGRAPKLAALFAFGAVASLGLPGLAGFWGEMLAMASSFSPVSRLPSSTYLVLMVLAGVGVVLTTAYFVLAVRRVCQGVPEQPPLVDVAVDEWVVWAPLVVMTFVLGLLPSLVLVGGAGVHQVVEWRAIAPPLCLVVAAVLVLLGDACWPAARRWLPTFVSLLAVGTAALITVTMPHHTATFCLSQSGQEVGCSWTVGHVTVVWWAITLIGAGLVILLLHPLVVDGELPAGEAHLMVLASATGAMGIAASGDLVTLLVSIETVSLPAFALVGLRRDGRGAEAALKFFLVSVVATAFTLLGISMVYGATGSVVARPIELAGISGAAVTPVIGIGMALTVIALAFKVAVVPFQAWVPDTYVGAPVPVAAYLSVVSKAAGLAGLVVLLVKFFPSYDDSWGPVVAVGAALTMSVGNLAALRQQHAVRLLAWSSVAQAGYLLVPIAAGAGVRDIGALQSYALMYAVVNLGAFAAVAAASRWGATTVSDMTGLARRHPLVGITLAFALLCLAGLPPGVIGLVAKVVIFQSAVDGALGWLAVVMAVNVAIGLVYYLRFIAVLFKPSADLADDTAVTPPVQVVSGVVQAVLALTLAAAAVLSVFPGLLLDAVYR